ncbi:SH3 domain-containing protein C23A1.17-like [Herpailurus yagouaroundi]|uniref:SH3 domain-containing protein C23A1.17-like n=1 Tax=Herpailurus yagouaroundi TaxID=1608482 RepID=UPI001AD7417E|nr:SH3 domain-containing protein C23A1.17-like [Puma yagouaroundi]
MQSWLGLVGKISCHDQCPLSKDARNTQDCRLTWNSHTSACPSTPSIITQPAPSGSRAWRPSAEEQTSAQRSRVTCAKSQSRRKASGMSGGPTSLLTNRVDCPMRRMSLNDEGLRSGPRAERPGLRGTPSPHSRLPATCLGPPAKQGVSKRPLICLPAHMLCPPLGILPCPWTPSPVPHPSRSSLQSSQPRQTPSRPCPSSSQPSGTFPRASPRAPAVPPSGLLPLTPAPSLPMVTCLCHLLREALSDTPTWETSC